MNDAEKTVNNVDNWVLVKDKLPDPGQDVILAFRDRIHKDPSWPKVAVRPAWRCNVGERDSPNGAWAIEHYMGFVAPIEDGIAWMPMPTYRFEEEEL